MLVMEASPVIGDVAEGCSSCESGWTMYLCSPAHHADDEEEEEDSEMESAAVSCISSKRIHGREGDEDDDSMASDASTGGIQRNLSCDQLDVTDDDDEEVEEDSNGAHGGLDTVKCCIQYPSQRSFPKRMCMVQEARSLPSGIMVPTSEANVVSDSKMRHDIVAGDKR